MKCNGDPVSLARLYEEELRRFFPDIEWPRFDLIYLGMGEDGHTASLFPGTTALHEEKAWVVANWVGKLETWRITLTAHAINHAKHIAFLVTGKSKAQRLLEVIKGPHDPERLPAQLIRSVDGTIEWLIDKSAAAYLQD